MKRYKTIIGFVILSILSALAQYVAIGRIRGIGLPLKFMNLYYSGHRVFPKIHVNLLTLIFDILVYYGLYLAVMKRKKRNNFKSS